MRWIPLLALFVACESDSNFSEYADSTLVPASVGTEEELEGQRRDWAGTVSVDGERGYYTISTSTTAGNVRITVNSPTNPDLSVLDGVSATAVSLFEDRVTGDLSFSVVAEDGPLYLMEPVLPTDLTTRAFGGNFIRIGDDIGDAPFGNQTLHLSSASIETPEGRVEVFPGQPVEFEFNRNFYRFVLFGKLGAGDAGRRQLCAERDAVLRSGAGGPSDRGLDRAPPQRSTGHRRHDLPVMRARSAVLRVCGSRRPRTGHAPRCSGRPDGRPGRAGSAPPVA